MFEHTDVSCQNPTEDHWVGNKMKSLVNLNHLWWVVSIPYIDFQVIGNCLRRNNKNGSAIALLGERMGSYWVKICLKLALEPRLGIPKIFTGLTNTKLDVYWLRNGRRWKSYWEKTKMAGGLFVLALEETKWRMTWRGKCVEPLHGPPGRGSGKSLENPAVGCWLHSARAKYHFLTHRLSLVVKCVPQNKHTRARNRSIYLYIE